MLGPTASSSLEVDGLEFPQTGFMSSVIPLCVSALDIIMFAGEELREAAFFLRLSFVGCLSEQHYRDRRLKAALKAYLEHSGIRRQLYEEVLGSEMRMRDMDMGVRFSSRLRNSLLIYAPYL